MFQKIFTFKIIQMVHSQNSFTSQDYSTVMKPILRSSTCWLVKFEDILFTILGGDRVCGLSLKSRKSSVYVFAVCL